jgi:hypothetical protein
MRLPTVLAVLALSACGGRKLADVEKDLEKVQAQERDVGRDVSLVSSALAESQRAQEAEQARLTRATRSLSSYQASVVRRWGGNPKKLAEMKKAHAMPAPLQAALDAAQNSAKDSTPERRFEVALEKEQLTDAAALLDGWEADEYSYEPETKDDACTPEVPKISKCVGNSKQAMLLCDGPDNTWLLWAEHGVLYTKSAPQTGLQVADRPAPGIWVLSHGNERSIFETADNNMLLRWVASLPAKSKLEWKNLDSDPFPEGVFESEGSVRLFDIESAHSISALSELDSCRKLKELGALPESAKSGCASREAAATAGPASTTGDAGH